MSKKNSYDVAGILNHYQKSKAVTIEEMALAVDGLICERAARSKREAFRKILKKVPNGPVIPGDEII